jgi:hypothetical protein
MSTRCGHCGASVRAMAPSAWCMLCGVSGAVHAVWCMLHWFCCRLTVECSRLSLYRLCWAVCCIASASCPLHAARCVLHRVPITLYPWHASPPCMLSVACCTLSPCIVVRCSLAHRVHCTLHSSVLSRNAARSPLHVCAFSVACLHVACRTQGRRMHVRVAHCEGM